MENLHTGHVIADIFGCKWWELGDGDNPLKLIKSGLTLQEALDGKVNYKCPVLKRDVTLKVGNTNANGYLDVECLESDCKHIDTSGISLNNPPQII
jgi:hypothetical protein